MYPMQTDDISHQPDCVYTCAACTRRMQHWKQFLHVLANPSRNAATNEEILEDIGLCTVLLVELLLGCHKNHDDRNDTAKDCQEINESAPEA